MTALLAAPAADAGRILWRVDERFPVFQGLDGSDADTWLMAENGAETTDAWYRRVSTAGSPFAAYARSDADSPWDRAGQRYRDEFLAKYVHGASVGVRLSLENARGDCTWEIGAERPITGPCTDHRASIPKVGASVRVRPARGDATTEMVRPRRLIVVGLGDSYASGEGNPDVASTWKTVMPPSGSYRWLTNRDYLAGTARWWDHECHRSFWSHQTIAALRLASEDAHRQVVFLHYACSGAEVFDGLLRRQETPPGRPIACESSRGSKCLIRRSQLRSVVEDLCPARSDPRLEPVLDLRRQVRELRESTRDSVTDRVRVDLHGCPRPLVGPDLVLVSIGGNDVGFARLVSWAIFPTRLRSLLLTQFWNGLVRSNAVVCPRAFSGSSAGCVTFDDQLLDKLPRKLDALGLAVEHLLGVPRDHVVLVTYPDPMRTGSPDPPYYSDPPGINEDGPWQGARAFGMPGDAELNIVASESKVLAESTIPDLRTKQREAAERWGWVFAAEAANAFVGHGWRQVEPGDPELRLPSTRGKPWPPESCGPASTGAACWRPFAAMGRFVRTINDSILTQTSDRSDSYTGTAHPTARGHAAIAESIRSAVASAVAAP